MQKAQKIKNFIKNLSAKERKYYEALLREKEKKLHIEKEKREEYIKLSEQIKKSDDEASQQRLSMIDAVKGIDISLPKILETKETNPVKQVPIKIPEPRKDVKVTNLQEIKIPDKIDVSSIDKQTWLTDEMEDNTKELTDAIKDIDIYDADNPVAVRLSDGNEFINQLIAATGNVVSNAPLPFTTSLSAGGVESRALVDSDGHQQIDIAEYALQVDDTTTESVTYVGEANAGSDTSDSVWKVKKIDETTGVIVTWADGDTNFDNIWDNFATLTYS